MKEKYPIDFIVSWVDVYDDNWVLEKNKYLGINTSPSDVRKRRFRDWDNFQYWFRAVEKYAPWVNHIYIISPPGQKPKWLNEENDKVTVIDQNTLMDEKYLPTFNNCAIELLLHKIPGLSEHFVYFCDDMFLNAPTTEDDFFCDGKPRDIVGFAANPIKVDENGRGICHIVHANTMLVSKHFDKNKVFKENRRKFLSLRNGRDLIKTITALPYVSFVGFNEPHTANSYTKSTFEDMWSKAEKDLLATMEYRFRADYTLSQWGIRYWQICMGNFEIRKKNFSEYFDMTDIASANRAAQCLNVAKKKVVCINDCVEKDEEFEAIVATVNKALNNKFPEKSKYENFNNLHSSI